MGTIAQTRQNINKTTGTVSNPINQIDSIRFNTNTNRMIVVKQNGAEDPHALADVMNVTFAGCLGTISVSDIDGNVYPIVQIGNQCWTAENLKTTRYNNGIEIPNVIENASWYNLTTPAWCNYENNPSYDTVYGKLYNWYTVDAGNMCPEGWHVPSFEEWNDLFNYLGGWGLAGGKMKTETGWASPNQGATNESGFSGLPSGGRYFGLSYFAHLGERGFWWSSTDDVNAGTFYTRLIFDSFNADCTSGSKEMGFSVRCLKD